MLIQQSKHIYLLIILLSFSFITTAQNCKYEKNEIDGLTELLIKRTTPSMLTRINGQPLYAKGQCIGSNKYLKLVFYKFNDFTFDEQREVGFILSNHDEVILFPRIVPVDSTKSEMADITSLLIYKLNDEQYQKLSQAPVIKFKYFVASGFIEADISSKKQSAVMQVLKCVE